MKILNLGYCLFLIFCTTHLPAQVIYQDINGKALNNGIIISWKTLEEENLKTFTLEKSVNGVQYFPIFECSSRNQKNQITSYNFLDTKTNNATNYYRIKEQLLNDAYSYSLVVEIEQKFQNKLLIEQVSDINNMEEKDMLSINYTSIVPGELIYSIEDHTRTILFKEAKFILKGSNLLKLDFALFPKGIYTIKMQLEDEIESILFEKLDNHFNFEVNKNMPRNYTVKTHRN